MHCFSIEREVREERKNESRCRIERKRKLLPKILVTLLLIRLPRRKREVLKRKAHKQKGQERQYENRNQCVCKKLFWIELRIFICGLKRKQCLTLSYPQCVGCLIVIPIFAQWLSALLIFLIVACFCQASHSIEMNSCVYVLPLHSTRQHNTLGGEKWIEERETCRLCYAIRY